jgi:hypothetical protein
MIKRVRLDATDIRPRSEAGKTSALKTSENQLQTKRFTACLVTKP